MLPTPAMFGVAEFSAVLEKVAARYGIEVHLSSEVVEINRMLLAEFDNTMKPHPTIPVIDTVRERYDMWLLKRYGPGTVARRPW